MSRKKLSYVLIIFTLILSSCYNENEEISPSIIGKWTVIESKLNGEEVNGLKNVEFTSKYAIFSHGGGLWKKGTYEIKDDLLKVEWVDEIDINPYELKIIELDENSLRWEQNTGLGILKQTLSK
ncbi:hypothetical protein [Tenacibaculum sp. nBUS_03]|uniref:hypothetical protein n=1 Tax=Tenacibaculum sp. nBUS_03 TaxID=3395320 RepID=UPI003EBF761D